MFEGMVAMSTRDKTIHNMDKCLAFSGRFMNGVYHCMDKPALTRYAEHVPGWDVDTWYIMGYAGVTKAEALAKLSQDERELLLLEELS